MAAADAELIAITQTGEATDTGGKRGVVVGDIYEYFDSVTGGRFGALLIQFFLSIFPAVVIDLIAPISTAFFLSEIDIIVSGIIGFFKRKPRIKPEAKPVEEKQPAQPPIVIQAPAGQIRRVSNHDNTKPLPSHEVF